MNDSVQPLREQPKPSKGSLEFTFDGLLPPGDYVMSIEEIRASILVNGADRTRYKNWDATWRSHLLDNFAVLYSQLRKVGVTKVFVDGSFVEDKEHPGDIDGYFECDPFRVLSGDLKRELNLLDPHKVWTWDPSDARKAPDSFKRKLPMWHQYRVELYPHLPGLPCNIKDKFGHQLTFPSAMRLRKSDDAQKGIIKIGGEG